MIAENESMERMLKQHEKNIQEGVRKARINKSKELWNRWLRLHRWLVLLGKWNMFSFILLRNQHKICSCCCISISEFPETCDCSLDGSTLRTLLSAQGFLNHPPTNKFVVFPSRKKDRSVIPQRGKPRLCNSQKIHIKKSTEFKNYFQNLLQNLSFELNSFVI